jgi:hypothetical protein
LIRSAAHRKILFIKTFFLLIGLWLTISLSRSFAANPPETTLPAAEAKTYLDIAEKLDPKKSGLFKKLERFYPNQTAYTPTQIRSVTDPTVPKPPDIAKRDALLLRSRQIGRPLPDAISKEDVTLYIERSHQLNPKSKLTWPALITKYDLQDWYTRHQLLEVEKNGAEFKEQMKRPETDLAEKAAKAKQNLFLAHWRTPLIRHDWSDVLATEDESQQSAKKTDDLVGATLSYAHDGKAKTDTWTTVGALIFPWVYDPIASGGLVPDHIVVAPSVSVNRVSTNGAPAGEVDQLFYRLGIFFNWDWNKESWAGAIFGPGQLELRAAGVYATDTECNAQMPGHEIDLEPHFRFNNGQGTDQRGMPYECPFKIGFTNTIVRKAALLDDLSDQSLVDYQLRGWLHMEGGDIQDVGKTWVAVAGSFFRLGPSVQFRLNLNRPLPFVFKGFSFTALYSYLPDIERSKSNSLTVTGSGQHDSILKLDATLAILADKTTNPNRKISLNANYTNGGLNFTKQDVDTFTLGLSVLF